MNILHIADFGRAGKINGVGEAVLNIAYEQRRLGENSMIFHTRPNSNLVSDIATEISGIRQFLESVKSFRPDIVIFHSFYDFSHPQFAKILQKSEIPYLITFHGGASKDNYKRKHFAKWLANKLIFKKYIRGACAVIYLNEGERCNSIFASLTESKSLILPNGIILPKRFHKFELEKKITISFVSRLDYKGKGLDILLPAIRSIENELKESRAQFKFFGYHYSDGTIEKIEALEPVCQYCGFVLNDEKEKAFLETDILILPSRSEGMPVSVLEALSYGIPSIVTPQTNVADILISNNCGWVANLTKEELANVILSAIKILQDAPDEIRQNCIRLSHEYEWKSIAATSINQYKNILSSSID